MTSVDATQLLSEALKVGPFVAVLIYAMILLWRKLEAKDQRMEAMHDEHARLAAALTREVLTALADNTRATESLREAIVKKT
jgi:hypothetical protein